ncbi:hypothetical protein D3C85_1340020 [compost metagenome]
MFTHTDLQHAILGAAGQRVETRDRAAGGHNPDQVAGQKTWQLAAGFEAQDVGWRIYLFAIGNPLRQLQLMRTRLLRGVNQHQILPQHFAQRMTPARKLLRGLAVDGFQPQQWRATGLQHRVLHLMGVLTELRKLAVAQT